MSRNYKFHDPEGLYFISFATVFWVDVFVRRLYFDCIVENLNYCIKEKGMEVFAWCVMPSHLHLVFRSTIQPPEELIRDFKSFTSKKIIKLIAENQQESRREWLLNSFRKAAAANSNNLSYQFWQQHNHPIQLWSAAVIQQKIDYTHHNPVEAGFVENDYEYLYSSARDYCGMKGMVMLLLINIADTRHRLPSRIPGARATSEDACGSGVADATVSPVYLFQSVYYSWWKIRRKYFRCNPFFSKNISFPL